MGLVVRKPVFEVSDKARLKPVSTATETSWNIEISLIAILDIILSIKGITKALISLQVFSHRGPYIVKLDMSLCLDYLFPC